MDNPLIVRKEQIVNATPAEIWEIFTTPKNLKEWMFVPGEATDEIPFGLGKQNRVDKR